MCYNAFTEKARTRRVAGENIKVCKICDFHNNMVISRIQHYLYSRLIVTNKVDLTFSDECGLPYIAEGYHSYRNCKWHTSSNKFSITAIVNDSCIPYEIHTNAVIAEFIIPKNTVYYENTNGEIVSEQIMFTGIIHKPIMHNNIIESVKIDLNEEDRAIFTETSK